MNNLNKYIDHTLLKADATENQIKKLCLEAIEYNFFSVCVNGSYLELAKQMLKDSDVKVCCVAGFPLGVSDSKSKLNEIENLYNNGADEVDFVVNIGHVRDKKYDLIKAEFKQFKQVAKNRIIKVILETCYISDEDIVAICKIADECNINFVKTSTGFGTRGATIEDVKLMKKSISDKTQVKASGGVRSYEDAVKMIDAGATRLGTSNGVAILTGSKVENNY